jgi:Ca-activated chloride channel homolog
MTTMRRRYGVWLAAALVLCNTACSDKRTDTVAVAPRAVVTRPAVFKVLATSDLRDAQPLEEMVEKATGVPLRFTYGGTMESVESVLTGKTDAPAAWFANAKYLLSESVAIKLGWKEASAASQVGSGLLPNQASAPSSAKVTWQTVTQAARDGKLHYALSNPATSNQGFMALMGVVAAASGKSEVLTAADVNREAIAGFVKGYALPGDTSTYLSDKFIEQQGNQVNSFINYEGWLLSLNRSGKLREKLTLVYPREGISTADYPFMLLKDERREDYLKVVNYLKGVEAQTWLAQQTLRRPINPEVAAATADLFPKGNMLIELPFSPSRDLADGLIDAYLNEFRRPIASTFVLDTSGSMGSDGRREQLIQALHYMTGGDNSLTGRLAKLTNRERVWMLPFSDRPQTITAFELPTARAQSRGVQITEDSEAKQKVLSDVRTYANQLQMTGGTAIYDSVLAALQHMMEQRKKFPEYQYSVVAFTDGENTAGRTLAEFKDSYARLPEDVRAIPVFMVLFGEADEAELKSLIKTTGGKVFDARTTPLYSVFKDIRAYQ